jgi:F-type H+-transporting ATPase subunit b
MAINWTTFLLEIVNFLVLIWLLRRFFYRPVLAAIARRREAIEQSLREAKAAQDQAAQLEQRYLKQVDAWEHDRRQAHERLQTELRAERDRQLRALEQDLANARERSTALERQREDSRARLADQEAAQLAQGFVTALVERLAGPELEARLVRLLLSDLDGLTPARRDALRAALRDGREAVQVATAFELGANERGELTGKLAAVAGRAVRCDFVMLPDLLAGLRITAGPWTLSANLREELRFFLEANREERTSTAAG